MKDSARPKQDDSATPVERPTWRFSGRRGTPVHMREQAPQTLPPEIRKAVTQLARERAGESAPAVDARPVRAASTGADLKLQRDGQAPPVAAAPMPVERRSDRGAAGPEVPTSHIPAAEAPLDTTELTPPAIEVETAPEPVVSETTPEPVAETVAEPEPQTTPEPVAEVTPAPERETAPAPEPETMPEPVAEAPKPEPAKAAPKLSAAERKKRAKARAKAKAKAQRAKKDSASSSDKARRLFARGREVDADAAAVVEGNVPVEDAPTATNTPEVTTTTDAPLELFAESTPEIPTPETTRPDVEAPEAPLEVTAEAGDEQSAQADDVPAPPPVADLPDLVPSLDAIDELGPAVELGPITWQSRDDEQRSTPASVEVPEPTLATESASQAAWELGRLPILLQETTAPAEPAPIEPEPATWESVIDTSDAVWEPAARVESVEQQPAAGLDQDIVAIPEPEPVSWNELEPVSATMHPIDWLPIGAQPQPAPIEPLDMPRRPAPEAIERLATPLEAPGEEELLARAGAREGMTPNARAAESRRRIARRRAELEDAMHALSGLGSGRRDSER